MPKLLMVPLKISPGVWMLKVAPNMLLNTAPVSLLKVPEPLQVATAALLSVRVLRRETLVVLVSWIPPLALVMPCPDIVPPDQAMLPVMFRVSVPVRVPALCV